MVNTRAIYVHPKALIYIRLFATLFALALRGVQMSHIFNSHPISSA